LIIALAVCVCLLRGGRSSSGGRSASEST